LGEGEGRDDEEGEEDGFHEVEGDGDLWFRGSCVYC
jgi:hypothetical protein